MSCSKPQGDEESKRKKWKFERIWPDEYLVPAQQGLVVVGEVKRAQDIPSVLSLLNKLHPLPELRHLKRVRHVLATSHGGERKAEVMVRRALPSEKDGQEVLAADVLPLPEHSALLHASCSVRPVCLTRPLTLSQLEASKRLWSTVSPNPLVCLDTHCLAAAEETTLAGWVDMLAEGGTGCAENSVIIADKASLHCALSSTAPSTPIDHPVLRALAQMAGLQSATQHGRGRAMDVLEKAEDVDASAYLCTGLTAVLATEPCVMCAMALVHARIARIVFLQEAPADGALKSVYKLQAIKQLNHRFQVWQALPTTTS